jgi:hypothetical protein
VEGGCERFSQQWLPASPGLPWWHRMVMWRSGECRSQLAGCGRRLRHACEAGSTNGCLASQAVYGYGQIGAAAVWQGFAPSGLASGGLCSIVAAHGLLCVLVRAAFGTACTLHRLLRCKGTSAGGPSCIGWCPCQQMVLPAQLMTGLVLVRQGRPARLKLICKLLAAGPGLLPS